MHTPSHLVSSRSNIAYLKRVCVSIVTKCQFLKDVYDRIQFVRIHRRKSTKSVYTCSCVRRHERGELEKKFVETFKYYYCPLKNNCNKFFYSSTVYSSSSTLPAKR